jgi:hypothetical protein
MSQLSKRTSSKPVSRPNMRKALARMEKELIALIEGAQGKPDIQLSHRVPEKRALWHWMMVRQELYHAYDFHAQRKEQDHGRKEESGE